MNYTDLQPGMRVDYYNSSYDKPHLKDDYNDNPLCQCQGEIKFVGPYMVMIQDDKGHRITFTKNEILSHEVSLKHVASGQMVTAGSQDHLLQKVEKGIRGRGVTAKAYRRI